MEDADTAAQQARDARSIYIGQVDYESTPEELSAHFAQVGAVSMVTIAGYDQGYPKGYAYLEFADLASQQSALSTLQGSIFKGRTLKVRTQLHRKQARYVGFGE
uniref:RRM domain-containing protein n=1 Tax=Florenciella parvula TaxID=236787 RepID=A0A7S2G490_9STRA